MAEPISDEAFIELWAQPGLSVAAIAAQLGIGVRAVNKRANGLGLPPKGQRVGRLGRLSGQLMRAVGAAGEEPGEEVPPWMADPELRPLFDELWEGLRMARTAQDLARLRPLQLRIHGMTALRFPWALDLLQVLAEATKLVLTTQKVEAELPAANDPVVLRQQAAQQLMREIGSVLGPDEQDELARMLRVATDRLMARRGWEALPASVAGDAVIRAAGGVPAVRAPW